MEISQHIKDEASTVLLSLSTVQLPVQFKSAPEFYLAQADDQTVLAFVSITHEGVDYKIGVLNG